MWDWMCVCDFYFSFYQAIFQCFKKMIIVEIRWCRRAERRSTIDWLTDLKSKKIDNWQLIDSKSKKIDVWIDVEDSRKKFDNWLDVVEWESWSRKYLQINMMKRSISQNEAKTKRYWFRKRVLSQTSRIWAFRVVTNRRVLIDYRLWEYRDVKQSIDALTTTKSCEEDEMHWLRDRLTLIVVFHLIMSCALVSLLWCNRFIFCDVDCEDVKNWMHVSDSSECKSLIACCSMKF